jgi:hypothetical protein
LKTSHKHTLSVFGLVCLLAAGAYALVRTPFAGRDAAQPLPGARMLVQVGGNEVPFTLDPDDTGMSQPQVGQSAAAVSFDGDLRDLPQTGPEEKTLGVEFDRAGYDGADPDFVDPVLQSASGGGIPGPAANFAGLDLANWGAGWPPDTNGDIGPNHYIQTVNTSIGIYNRAGTQLAAFTFNTFFPDTPSLAACSASNDGDPIVLYDDVSGRWIITDFAWTDIQNGPYYECIAVSKTADPVAGGWWYYALDTYNPSGFETQRNLNDYPKLGVWHDGIYMTANMFDCTAAGCAAATYEGVKIWALNRSELINGLPLNYQYGNLGTAYFSLLPSHARGSAIPPAGTPNYLGELFSTTLLHTWKLSINWNHPGNSSLTGPVNTAIAAFSLASSVPQPAGPNVDSLSDRLMAQFQYTRVNGVPALWVTHSVSTSGRAAIRWYEFRNLGGTPSVYQQGTFSPDATHRWMGAVGVDKFGNMAVVYSASSSSVHPGIRYTGRQWSDALGVLDSGEATLVNGSGSQTAGGFGRWGDYAGMSIDPVDSCTFWFTTEYYNVTGTNWQTRIGSFSFPNCSNPAVEIYLPVTTRD